MKETKDLGGRPAQGGPVVSVNIDGVGVAWCDGVFAGDRDLVEQARYRALLQAPASLVFHGRPTPAGSETPLQAASAMVGINPGRAILMEAPDDVLAYLNEDLHECVVSPLEDEEEDDDVQE